MDLGFIFPLAVFAFVALCITGIHSLLAGDTQRVRERIKRFEPRAAEVATRREEATLLKDQRFSGMGWIDKLVGRTSIAEKVALDVARAGVPLRVAEYFLLRWLCAAFLAMLVLAMGQTWIVAPMVGVVGFYIPKFYLNHLRQKRVKRILAQLIDAINLITNSLRSGYAFTQGIELVTREMPAPIAEEFRQMLAEMNLGSSAEEALNNLTNRVPSYDLDLVATALVVQRQVGGNLAEVLDNIAHTIRERIRIMGEVRARTAQARMSGMVVGLMPVFLMAIISVLNSEYMRIMFSSALGIIGLGVAFTLEITGYLVMKRLVAIEV